MRQIEDDTQYSVSSTGPDGSASSVVLRPVSVGLPAALLGAN